MIISYINHSLFPCSDVCCLSVSMFGFQPTFGDSLIQVREWQMDAAEILPQTLRRYSLSRCVHRPPSRIVSVRNSNFRAGYSRLPSTHEMTWAVEHNCSLWYGNYFFSRIPYLRWIYFTWDRCLFSKIFAMSCLLYFHGILRLQFWDTISPITVVLEPNSNIS